MNNNKRKIDNKIHKVENTLKINKISNYFQLVNFSSIPVFISFALFNLLVSILMHFNNIMYHKYYMLISVIVIFIIVYTWVQEILIESNLIGLHTVEVSKMLYYGFVLFVLSEVLIFGTLFFSFFYNTIIPSIEVYNTYPHYGIHPLNSFSLPLFNTIILYISGLTATCSLNYYYNNSKNSIVYLFITIILSLLFTSTQYIEYNNALFTLLDGIFGTNFYTLTMFHAIHVIVGASLLIITFIRIINRQISNISLKASTLYWAMVDWIWIFLFIVLYMWISH